MTYIPTSAMLCFASIRRLLVLSCLGAALVVPAASLLAQDQDAGADPQDAAQAAAQAQQGAQDQPDANADFAALVQLVDNYYHTARMANYTAAQAYGSQIIGGNYDPEMVLDAFNEVHRRRSPQPADLDELMLRWQRADELSAVATEVAALVNKGRVARATNRRFIAEQVERLAGGSIAYRNALAQLRYSGEYAVPVMIEYLQDREKARFHADIRRAMRELGVDMLSPLWAACQMDNEQVLTSIMTVLGDLQYDASIPYLLEQFESSQAQAVRNAAQQALQRLGYTGGSSAAEEFHRLGERFFYEQTPVLPNSRLGTATIWSWGGEQAGLVRTDVPPQIFNEVMAMRAAGKALALGERMDDALSLWLASNYRREGELGEGEVDRTQPEGSPTAHFYGAQAGTHYLLKVLERAEADRVRLARGNRYNAADVSLRAIKSLQEIAGRGNIGAGETPLTTAMNFPDRRVRIEAAFALAQSLPLQPIAGQEQVVPLLADALSQTGQPSVLVISANQELANRTVEQLKAGNYRAAGAGTVVDAVAQAQQLPSVDVLVIDSRLGDREIDSLFVNAQSNPKISGAAKLVMVNNQATRYEQLKLNDPTLETTLAVEGETLTQAIEAARTSVGGLPLEAAAATELAMRSGELLRLLGTRNSIFRVESGEEFLLAALSDQRPEVRTLAGEVVALLDSSRSQPALLDAALRPEESPEVRISFFNSLSASAKFFGNRLNGDQIDRLLAAAANLENLEVQASAAEAVGAANLPSDQARRLIIEQTTGTERAAVQAETAGTGSDQ